MGDLNGQVMFGLINIPVKVRTMTSPKRGAMTLRTLHKERPDGEPCLTPINEQKVCRACDMDVEADDLIKGYEVTKGNFLPLTEEELETAEDERSPLIELTKFVKAPDPMWVEKEYWLPAQNPEVQKLAEVYATFSDAMESTGLVGFGKAALWGKEKPVTVSGKLRMLTLQILYPSASFNEPPLPVPFPVKERELAEMVSILQDRADVLTDNDLVVESAERLKELVAAKINGTEWVAPEPVVVAPPTVDLLETLRSMKAEPVTL